MKKCVAVVGRPNVGKSTLFNRLLKSRRAIVADTPGVTRDRLFAELELEGRSCLLVDTGGLVFAGGDNLQEEISRQSRAAVDEADIIIFLLDGQTGIAAEDQDLARWLRRSGKPILWVVNKCEAGWVRQASVDFYALGAEELLPISAEHGEGIGDLKERLAALLPEPEEEAAGAVQQTVDDVTRISVVGKPNVGKSSLLNRLLGRERLTTSERPGTTVDAIALPLRQGDRDYLFFDTAGLRRRAKVKEEVESLSNIATLRAIDFARIVILMIDVREGLTDQDIRISSLAQEKGKAVLYLFNKLDLVEKAGSYLRERRRELEETLYRVRRPMVLGISVKSGRGVKKIFPALEELAAIFERRIGTGELNRWLAETVFAHPHPLINRRPLKFYFMTQARTAPPTFVLFVNKTQGLLDSYRRYLENRLIEDFGFYGVPVRLLFRRREGRRRK
jgi:GTP-binding protein